jgi:hypothetical protein
MRVGVAGHLFLKESELLKATVTDVLRELKAALFDLRQRHAELLPLFNGDSPAPECRIITSLASGADQFAAELASSSGSDLGYAIDAILPLPAEKFKADIATNCAENSRIPAEERAAFTELSLSRFDRLFSKARRRLEFEEGLPSRETYARAGSAVLTNCDVLLIIAGAGADGESEELGSSRWLLRRAVRARTPVLQIGPDAAPAMDLIEWKNGAPRTTPISLDDDGKAKLRAALGTVLLPSEAAACLPDSGFLERRYRMALNQKKNRDWWDEQFASAPSRNRTVAQGEAGGSPADDFRQTAIWADHRASCYAELARGAFIFTSLFGLLAVIFAVVGVLLPSIGIAGKTIEVACIALALLLIRLSKRGHWRDRWLGYRQIERRANHAAYLSLTGQSVRNLPVSTLLALPSSSRWPEWYFGAIARAAGTPDVELSQIWISQAASCIEANLVARQIRFFESEAHENECTNRWLEKWINWSLRVSLIITGSFLAAALVLYLTDQTWEEGYHWAMHVATFAGAICPAAAAALSAIRSHGEYAQQAGRYETAKTLLEDLQETFPSITDSAPQLRETTQNAVTVLADEVFQWRNMRDHKQIDL